LSSNSHTYTHIEKTRKKQASGRDKDGSESLQENAKKNMGMNYEECRRRWISIVANASKDRNASKNTILETINGLKIKFCFLTLTLPLFLPCLLACRRELSGKSSSDNGQKNTKTHASSSNNKLNWSIFKVELIWLARYGNVASKRRGRGPSRGCCYKIVG